MNENKCLGKWGVCERILSVWIRINQERSFIPIRTIQSVRQVTSREKESSQEDEESVVSFLPFFLLCSTRTVTWQIWGEKKKHGKKELDRFSTDSTFTHRSECVCAKAQRHQKKKDRVVFPIYCGLKEKKDARSCVVSKSCASQKKEYGKRLVAAKHESSLKIHVKEKI